MKGRIVKGIAGFYYVNTENDILFECKAKGVFRNRDEKPLVGDNVEFEIVDEENLKGNITKLLPRRNEIIRPAVANVDMALVVFAISNPKPNLNLLDRFLVMMEYMDVKTMICFNKVDETTQDDIEEYKKIYEPAGFGVLFTSTLNGEGIDDLKKLIYGKTIVFAGPSGVGKSSILNCIMDEKLMDTGEISRKIGRGKHTTRHSEIFRLRYCCMQLKYNYHRDFTRAADDSARISPARRADFTCARRRFHREASPVLCPKRLLSRP